MQHRNKPPRIVKLQQAENAFNLKQEIKFSTEIWADRKFKMLNLKFKNLPDPPPRINARPWPDSFCLRNICKSIITAVRKIKIIQMALRNN